MENPFEILNQVNERLGSIEAVLKTLVPLVPEKKTDDRLITRKQAAELLGVSVPTALAWTKEGILKGFRIGSRIRYKKNEIMSALSQIRTKQS